MTGLNVALHTGATSLYSRQKQLAVTGQNIANADRPGYHRQIANTQTNYPLSTHGGQIGTGVHIEQVLRVYDSTLENNLRQSVHQDGYNQALAGQLQLLEATLAPNGTSPVQDSMQDFADSWQSLSVEPESQAFRTDLIQQGHRLAQQYSLQHGQLVNIRDNLADSNGPLAADVNSINQKAQEIAELNRQISDFEQRRWQPQQANDLRDRRDELVSEISKLTDVQVTEQPDHTYTVTVDGRDMVIGDTVQATLQLNTSPTPNVAWADNGTVISPAGGEIQGLIEAWDNIDQTISGLESFATEMATAINTTHGGGFDQFGAAGGALFDASVPGQLTFMVNDPSLIAAATAPTAQGDGTNATNIWQALHTPLAGLGGNTALEHMDLEIDRIASQTASALAMAQGSSAGVVMFEQAIHDLSGVNMDQEILSMLEIQRSYQATARFVNIVDEMLGDAIATIG